MVTVFLSYRHEGDNAGVVRAFAERLEGEGLTVVLDQFAQEREFNGGGPDQGWPRWCKAQAGNPAHKVLVIATPGWFRCYEQTEVPGTGLGAAAEAGVLEQVLYNAGGVAREMRIVRFTSIEVTTFPLDLQRYHCFSDPSDFANIVSWLKAGAPAAVAAADWPAVAPTLKWPMADHDGVHRAFLQLITRDAPFRFLPIRGDSETGKSQITRLLLGHGLRCAGLACGRFDFKGTSDVDAELQRLVQHLGVPLPPAGPSLAQRLGVVLAALQQRNKPALLIFDTFEMAGAAEQWVKDALLFALIPPASRLRVVVAGQRVPEPGGTSWEDCAHSVIPLHPPALEDWYRYGKERKPGITEDFVRQAHELCGGKPSVLAQLFGAST